MKTIDVTVGIYNTEYTLIRHRDGSMTVRVPYISWRNNTGMLAFRTVKVPSGERSRIVNLAFVVGQRWIESEQCTLDDVLFR